MVDPTLGYQKARPPVADDALADPDVLDHRP
jgi:hypothetical protein